MKPSTTLIVVIHEPDFGADFNHEGNIAKIVNGRAKAKAKANIPMAGANQLPVVVVCTSNIPMIGPVQEKDTSTSVKAIRKMESSPLVLLALLMRKEKWRDGTAALTGVLAIVLGVLVSRLFFGLMDESLGRPLPLWAMLRFNTGGYSMIGALLGAGMGGIAAARMMKKGAADAAMQP